MLARKTKNPSQATPQRSNTLWTRFRKRVRRWALKRRVPLKQVLLDRNNLFIVPTGSGLALLLVMALIWLMGTNYDNNLVLGLAFFLGSLLVVCILQTHSSLAGLRLEAVKSQPCFMGDESPLQLRLSASGRREYPDIRLNWAGHHPLAISVSHDEPYLLELALEARRRGRLVPPLLRVESRYPLGLIRCWAWIRLDLDVVVYPKPQPAGPLPNSVRSSDEGESEALLVDGAEDFSGFRSYREGESLRHVSWKHYAQGKGMFVKEFQAYAEQSLWVDWDFLSGLDRETRLQRLCYWVLQLANGKQAYGLRLPGLEIAPGLGGAHRQRVLEALALFEDQLQAPIDDDYWLEGYL